MYKVTCKDLGFECNFIINTDNKEILAINIGEHLRISHKHYYPKNEIIGFIDIQNEKQNNLDTTKNKKLTYINDYESFRLEKWNLGHRNFP